MKTLFTSESVTSGHPDKVCDQIADAILDAILDKDEFAHVACEATAVTDRVHIFGEVTSTYMPDYESITRKVIRRIGYTKPGCGFDADTCKIDLDIHTQSPDIAMGVNKSVKEDSGAGDQGMMFGYASDETLELMPYPITLAHKLAKQLEIVRSNGNLPYLCPDGKTQVTIEYVDGKPKRVAVVVVSAQHCDDVEMETLRSDIERSVIQPIIPQNMIDNHTEIFINPTGRFVTGGPAGDSGLTGRKLIVDTYGGYARHGGGAFSGKDATKVDRSGAYMARYIAKNIVTSGIAKKCEVQLSYAIGVAHPVSVYVNTFATAAVPDAAMSDWLCSHIDMRPEMIIRRFNLRAPIFSSVSCYGHFGENAKNMPWEQTDMAEELRQTLVLK